MFVEQYFSELNQEIRVSREQASAFAKQVADDFNPIHDVDAKRFCVPGDLLFAIILAKTGLSEQMTIRFAGMVSEETRLHLPDAQISEGFVTDSQQKPLVEIKRQGQISHNVALIESLIRAYVSFSGHCFPHVFVDLMKNQEVMINPARPVVMYEKMSLSLESVDARQVILKCKKATLDSDGKRGNARFEFDLLCADTGKLLGHGAKNMLLGGLKPYCDQEMTELVSHYNGLKENYIAA